MARPLPAGVSRDSVPHLSEVAGWKMARPKKYSLTYFPWDVGALADEKLLTARKRFGYLATMVYLALLDLIYGDKGYYLRYDEESQENVLWTLTTGVLAGKYQPEPETVAQVIDQLAASGLFSGDLYQRGILTSKRIQATYYRTTLDRKALPIVWEYWILEESEMRAVSTRSVILSNFINRPKNPGYSVEKSSYSTDLVHKEKEREIILETILENISERKVEETGAFLVSYQNAFQKHFGKPPSRSHLTGVEHLLTAGRSGQELLEALDEAAQRKPADPEPYVYVVLRDYEKPQQDKNRESSEKEQPTGALGDWEDDWLEELRQQRREREGFS